MELALCWQIFTIRHLLLENEHRNITFFEGWITCLCYQGIPLVEESCMSMIDRSESFTETDIIWLLKMSSNPFYAVDPIPTWLLKDCLDVPISPVTKLVNTSLSLGVFPRSMKAAQ